MGCQQRSPPHRSLGGCFEGHPRRFPRPPQPDRGHYLVFQYVITISRKQFSCREASDSGNLVLKGANDQDVPENYIWQSFDYPSDTFLPGMKFGVDNVTGLARYLWSWTSNDDPAPGDYTYRMDPNGYPQYFLRKEDVKQFRSGPWNGIRFSGMPTIYSNPIYNFSFVMNQRETYFTYDLLNSSVVSRMVLNQIGVVQRMTWIEGSNSWVVHFTTEMTNCDMYAFCGPYGLCTVGNTPECNCLQGFEPKFPKDWGTDWSNGIRGLNVSMTLKECEAMCLKDCSCMAYANSDVNAGGSGCLLWFDELVDIREFTENGQDLYVRMAASELVLRQADHNGKKTTKIIVVSIVSTGTGTLEDGQEIAVKLLSKKSRQGDDEFKNEVICIAKLQHRNLVKLLGYCIQEEERILIYEYMPNNTWTPSFFDESRKMLLDWPKRFHIINGIARGLLYLHQDSRLRIIHRDLKGSNILLDCEMNPKISDFGLARVFGGNETEANTKRVVGTYGYMSPEYAIDGLFSVKSDVFSFGVLVLEIVSGKRNRGFCDPNHHLNLLGHGYGIDGSTHTKLNPSATSVAYDSRGFIMRATMPEDRPNMSSAVLMLGGEGALAQPKQPGFFTERNLPEAKSSQSEDETFSANMVTITVLEAR
ncbi:S-locus lectin protein kinase family protein [Actinidia rufa]|uniref:S-locus lectin protein kinase family protein n=1 Tax=Actinidia rufa TaxID=165716 RepID=A0A7J0GNP7_9ERIC|nr:S-locus lectin protein kinase family protein [Actinidia rufa]